MTANKLTKMINHGQGKQALDEMITAGMSVTQIHDMYDAINFYPNEETCTYIVDQVTRRDRRNRATKEALKELNGFFANIGL